MAIQTFKAIYEDPQDLLDHKETSFKLLYLKDVVTQKSTRFDSFKSKDLPQAIFTQFFIMDKAI